MFNAICSYVVVAVMTLLTFNNLVITDEKPSVNVSLTQKQVSEIARGIDSGKRIVIDVSHAKLRSCGNNVSGVYLLICGFHTHIIEFGPPSLTQPACDFEIDITDQVRMVRPFRAIWDGKLQVVVKPIFTDKNVKGCFSINIRKVELKIKDSKK